MRILHISPYPPERDGIGDYCARMCGALTRRGQVIGVIAARCGEDVRPETLCGLPGAARASQAAALRAVSGFGPDVVHLQFAVASYGMRLPALLRLLDALRRSGLPTVITMHEVTRDTDSLRRPGRALYRAVARRADRIIVHTERARQRLVALAPATCPVSVIAHPTATPPVTDTTPEQLRARHGLGEDGVVLAFGFIDVDKGLGDLLRATAILEREGILDGMRCVIAGGVRRRFGLFRIFELRDRVHLRSLHRDISRLHLGERILFTGYVPDGDVAGWLSAAQLVVLPYRRCEQSGVANLARAAGTAVLTSDAGELGSLGDFDPCPTGDAAGLARGIERALASTADRTRRAPRVIDDLDARAGDTIELYRQLTSSAMPAAEAHRLAWAH